MSDNQFQNVHQSLIFCNQILRDLQASQINCQLNKFSSLTVHDQDNIHKKTSPIPFVKFNLKNSQTHLTRIISKEYGGFKCNKKENQLKKIFDDQSDQVMQINEQDLIHLKNNQQNKPKIFQQDDSKLKEKMQLYHQKYNPQIFQNPINQQQLMQTQKKSLQSPSKSPQNILAKDYNQKYLHLTPKSKQKFIQNNFNFDNNDQNSKQSIIHDNNKYDNNQNKNHNFSNGNDIYNHVKNYQYRNNHDLNNNNNNNKKNNNNSIYHDQYCKIPKQQINSKFSQQL